MTNQNWVHVWIKIYKRFRNEMLTFNWSRWINCNCSILPVRLHHNSCISRPQIQRWSDFDARTSSNRCMKDMALDDNHRRFGTSVTYLRSILKYKNGDINITSTFGAYYMQKTKLKWLNLIDKSSEYILLEIIAICQQSRPL